MLRRGRSGHSPSIRPMMTRSSKSPYRAACASINGKPASAVSGANVSSSIHRLRSGAISSIVASRSSCSACAAANDSRMATTAACARRCRSDAGARREARNDASRVSCTDAGARSSSGCSASAASIAA